jgi:histone deacetylase 11
MEFLKWIPNFLLKRYIINSLLYQTGSTILAGEVAMKYGFSINLGGGMHHASSDDGGGWCMFSDIPLSIKNLKTKGLIERAMIVDLDAHQGNGHERDKLSGAMGDPNSIYIIDAYNPYIYPNDKVAKMGINRHVHVTPATTGEEYLYELEQALNETTFVPDVIFYNAGTDVLEGDRLGKLHISEDAVIKRDEIVFQYALQRWIPIIMVTSGGYQKSNANVIARSIANLFDKFNLKQVAEIRYLQK